VKVTFLCLTTEDFNIFYHVAWKGRLLITEFENTKKEAAVYTFESIIRMLWRKSETHLSQFEPRRQWDFNTEQYKTGC